MCRFFCIRKKISPMLSFAIQYLYCPYVLSSTSNSYDLKDFCSYDLMYHCDHMFMSEASNSPSHVETSDNNCCFVINFSLFWCFAVSLHLKLLLFQAETRQTWSIDIIWASHSKIISPVIQEKSGGTSLAWIFLKHLW